MECGGSAPLFFRCQSPWSPGTVGGERESGAEPPHSKFRSRLSENRCNNLSYPFSEEFM